MCRLYDYGIDAEYAYLGMASYNCSLKQWRAKQTEATEHNLSPYFQIFLKVFH